jgi:hypothetical protein
VDLVLARKTFRRSAATAPLERGLHQGGKHITVGKALPVIERIRPFQIADALQPHDDETVACSAAASPAFGPK